MPRAVPSPAMVTTAKAATVAIFVAVGRARLALAAGCPPGPARPEAPEYATGLNGIAWPELCLEPRELEEHFFIIGDWGGIFQGPGQLPIPAYDAKRSFVPGVDDRAQLLVATQLKLRAAISQPRYLLNVGDNFYWGGVNSHCGEPSTRVLDSTTAQWESVYEAIYNGPDLAGKVWMGVLGNHDYGGFMFTKGWDQAIAYTWGPTGRWLTPALYWSRYVRHPEFTVDYYFLDSNVNNAFPEHDNPGHNLCSLQNNPPNASCPVVGPSSPAQCLDWFQRLWEKQILWLERRLAVSHADWRMVVTHFPPEGRAATWERLSAEYGIDLIVTGHRHQQEVHYQQPGSVLFDTAYVVSGGGGGITSEGMPRVDGQDDQYGFMDITISRDSFKIEAISHTGIVRSTTIVPSKRPTTSSTDTTTMSSTNTTTTATPLQRMVTAAPATSHPDAVQPGQFFSSPELRHARAAFLNQEA